MHYFDQFVYSRNFPRVLIFHSCQCPLHAVTYFAIFPFLSIHQIVYMSVHEDLFSLQLLQSIYLASWRDSWGVSRFLLF